MSQSKSSVSMVSYSDFITIDNFDLTNRILTQKEVISDKMFDSIITFLFKLVFNYFSNNLRLNIQEIRTIIFSRFYKCLTDNEYRYNIQTNRYERINTNPEDDKVLYDISMEVIKCINDELILIINDLNSYISRKMSSNYIQYYLSRDNEYNIEINGLSNKISKSQLLILLKNYMNKIHGKNNLLLTTETGDTSYRLNMRTSANDILIHIFMKYMHDLYEDDIDILHLVSKIFLDTYLKQPNNAYKRIIKSYNKTTIEYKMAKLEKELAILEQDKIKLETRLIEINKLLQQ